MHNRPEIAFVMINYHSLINVSDNATAWLFQVPAVCIATDTKMCLLATACICLVTRCRPCRGHRVSEV